MSVPLVESKETFRRQAKARRQTARAEAGSQSAARIAGHILADLPVSPSAVIGGYVAIRDELDPLPALSALIGAGCQTALPVVQEAGQPLVYRAWSLLDPLVPGAFGVPTPLETCPTLDPDIVLVPLLAFDRQGGRMGYGAGYYDRTLAHYRQRRPIVAVGLAYAGQEVDRVPTDAHDQPLDWVVTERQAIACEKG